MSDSISDDYTHENSYDYGSSFESHNAAYIVRNPNSSKSVKSFPVNYTPNATLNDFKEVLSGNEAQVISIKCEKCNFFIEINDLNDHIDYHNALKALNYKDLPKTIDDLIKRRKLLVKAANMTDFMEPDNINKNKLCEWEVKIKKINDSYEILKSYMDGSFDTVRKLRKNLIIDAEAESVVLSNPAVVSIGSCEYQNKKYNKVMEDANVIIETFGQNTDKTYVGVFDGYDGNIASYFCATQLHIALTKEISKFDETVHYIKNDDSVYDEINNLERYSTNGIDLTSDNMDKSTSFNETAINEETDEFKIYLNNIRNAFYSSYKKMDKLLSRGRNEKSKTRWSGATGVTCLIESMKNNQNWLHIANCGDVEALLIYNDKNKSAKKSYKVLTNLHTLKANSKEKERVEKAGCRLVQYANGSPKIQGLYDITRAFGFHGDLDVKKFVTYTPSIRSIELDENCACILIATKGLWSVLNYETVTELVLEMLPSRCVVSPFSPDPNVKELIHRLETSREIAQEIDETTQTQSEIIKSTNNITKEDSKQDFSSATNEILLDQSSDRTNKKSLSLSDEQFYRPSTVPDEYLHKDTKNSNFDKKLAASLKSNSDIFPLQVINSKKTQKEKISELVELEFDFSKYLTDDRALSKASGFTDIFSKELFKDTTDEIIQVNKYDIERELRRKMESALRIKFDLTEQITKRLVSSALLAGSCDSVTINCIMLPGSGIG